jgi:kynurenine formamidase
MTAKADGEPSWRELPELSAGARSAWGVAPPGDRLGTLRRLTPERTVAAADLVRTGRRIRLDLPVDQPDPPLFSREPLRREVIRMNRVTFDDRLDNYYPQAGSQWDALGHMAHRHHGFYGGRDAESVADGALGIEAAAEGIVGRGVLLDVARWAQTEGRSFDPGSPHRITPDDALATAAAQGTALEPGDVWLLRSGWIGWYRGLEEGARRQVAASSRGEGAPLTAAGLAPGRQWAELLWDRGAAAVAMDNPGVDALPSAREDGSLHGDGLALLGLTLGELLDLDELGATCAAEERWEFLFVAVPLLVPGGMGSPANALAIL